MMKTEKGGRRMKCQNCGINYLDEDRECPICGARAGVRGRVGELEKKAAVWRERQMEDSPDYRKTRPRASKAKTGAQKARPSAKPMRDKKPGLGKGKSAIVVVVVVVLLNLLPGIISVVGDIAEHYAGVFDTFVADAGWGAAEPEPDLWDDYEDDTVYYTPGGTYEYDVDNYTYVYVRLHELLGDYAMGTLSDGATVKLWVDEYDNYTLMIEDGTGTYDETGYTWCVYNYPEEELYDDNYPPDQYDSLTLCLTMDNSGYDGAQPERYDGRQEIGADLWLMAYVDRATGLLTLQDVDGTNIFGADTFVSMRALEQG